MLLAILSGLTYTIMTLGFVFFILALLPLAFIILFSVLEFAIAFIQAFAFVVLTLFLFKGCNLFTLSIKLLFNLD